MKFSHLAALGAALTFPAAPGLAQDARPDTVTVTGEAPPPLELLLTEEPAPVEPDAAGGGGSQSVVSYTPDYFAPFSPTSAGDMVNRVPGFSPQGGGGARGFGANAGNILINGERPSAQSQSVGDILQRIPVSEVVRIDLIRGQVAGVDMGGQVVVVNVIRRVSTRAGGTWRVQANYNQASGVVRPNGEINRNFSLLGANVSAGLTVHQFPQGARRVESYFDPSGAPIQLNEQNRKARGHGYDFTFTADRPLGEWTMRLNGRLDIGGFQSQEYNRRVAGEARPRPPQGGYEFPYQRLLRYDFEQSRFKNDQHQWELGGDLERPLTGNLRLKIIALQSMQEQDSRTRFSVFDTAGFANMLISESGNTTGESILRSFVTWTPSATRSLEAGGEIAYNFRDSETDIFIDTGGGPAPIPLPLSDTKVEEIRAEPFVSMLWRPRPDLALQTQLLAEVSQIRQTGDAQQTRSFFYPKGSATLTWDVRPRTQFRLTLERSVAQLSFGDFASSVSFSDDTQDTGNPDLVPQQTWRARSILEQRFWDDGVVSLEFTREWIEDAQGLIPLPGGGEGPGNLGDADEWEIEVSVDAPLDRAGLPNARLSAFYEYGDSSVIDPVTGERRHLGGGGGGPFFFGGDRRWGGVDFRQDYPRARMSWGVSWRNGSGSYNYRINEIMFTVANRGGVDAWVETTRFFGVNMRLQVNNIGNIYTTRDRFLFAGPRDVAPLALTERRREYNELGINFRIRGAF